MLALTLLAVFVATVYGTVIVGLRMAGSVDEREDVRQQLANALDRFTREARMARNVDTARDGDFQFDADFNGDGSSRAADGETNITYCLNNGVFERKQGGNAALTLAEDIDSVAFDYVDSSGTAHDECTGACNKGDLRVAQVTLTATKDSETLSMTAAVFLDNMSR